MARPDFAAVRQQASVIERSKEMLGAIGNSKNEIAKALYQSAYEVFQTRVDEILEDTPIEKMSFASHGVPVRELKAAGYENVYQIKTASYSQLAQVEGMDGKLLQNLFDALGEVRTSAERKASVRITADRKTVQQSALILDLYRYAALESVFAETERLQTKYGRCFRESLPASREITSFTQWLFAPLQKKKRVSEAAQDILNAVNSELPGAADKLYTEQCRVMLAEAGEAWTEFEKRPAEYYAKLEKFLDTYSAQAQRLGAAAVIPRKKALKEMLPVDLADEVEKFELDTSCLDATLRGYQDFGVKYMLAQEHALVGDEMGLGKTIQAIAAMAHLWAKGAQHFLVICPASVLINWVREIRKFSTLPAYLLHGVDFADELIGWFNHGGIAVTNFEAIPKLKAAGELNLRLSLVVVDEAHFVKNPQAKRTANVKEIIDKADRAVFMTGTPLENNVKEMQNLIGMLSSELRGKLSNNAKQFEKQACAVYLRRIREDVLAELPDKIEKEEWCDLGYEEKRVYRQEVNAGNFMGMRQVSWNVSDITKSSKAMRLQEIAQEAVEDGRKVIVFSFFLNTLQRVKDLFGEAAAGPITGSVPTAERQRIIDEFSSSETQKVLVCQAISGGTGLNIQAASVVVFCEPQIKPSIETQAISRAYRMGQVHDVLVYRLLADNTVDERIMELLAKKQGIFDEYAERSLIGDENLKRLSDGVVKGIVEAEAARLKAEEPDGAEMEEAEEATEISGTPDDAKAESNAGADEASEAKETKKKRPRRERRDRESIIRERYPNGELKPEGTYVVGTDIPEGEYFIRVQDAREAAAEVNVYASAGNAAIGEAKETLRVNDACLVRLETGEVISLKRADLVTALRPGDSESTAPRLRVTSS